MYEEYFRLSDAPFRLNPDPRFFYGSRSHNKAMAYLHYGLKQAEGFIVITGPVGAGKSMIIGHLLDQLNSSNVVAANLLTSNIEPQDLLSQILSAFRVEPEGEGRTGEIEAFEDYLFDQLNRGRRVLLIIDEAQNLPFKTLEELRMLSNIDYEGTPLFQVFLVGQPEFRTIIESPEMEQLRQRVIASYHLENLSEDETRDYIQHRLSVAGWREDPAFTDNAYKAIYKETTGLPRRINTLCNRLMLYCSLEKKHEITAKIVETVCAELREEKLEARQAVNATPPATKIDEQLDAEQHTILAETKPPEEVVVSIDSARGKTNPEAPPARAASKTEAPSTTVNTAPPQQTPEIVASSMSVLDRLRARKECDAIERQEATLTDVASAIAAAAGAPQETFAADGDDDVEAADIAAPPGWRAALIRSIDEAREELKGAHAGIVRLTRAAAADEARMERRREIAERLSRAEALLDDLRAARS